MSALMSWLKGERAPVGVVRKPIGLDGVVLPRFLRRPARLFGHLLSGAVPVPRYATFSLNAGLVAAACLYGAYLGGHMPTVAQAATARLGFAVEEVKITGHHETSEIDILEQLGLDGWTSTIGFDPQEARDRIAALPWIESAEVRKVYPDVLQVNVVERTPFAIWQHGRQLSVIERSGRIITPYTGDRRGATLPLIIGAGAPQAAPSFIEKVRALPELSGKVKGYIRIGERRWNLRLENGITVKLPERGEGRALEALVDMDRRTGLLSRDIVAVDMRLSDRLVVQLTPEAASRREAAVKDLLKGKSNRGART